LALALSPSFAACSAHVELQASPHYICAGQPVQLSWTVTGVGTMTSRPPLASFAGGQLANQGQMTVASTESTEI
jgi:hypothetical protein